MTSLELATVLNNHFELFFDVTGLGWGRGVGEDEVGRTGTARGHYLYFTDTVLSLYRVSIKSWTLQRVKKKNEITVILVFIKETFFKICMVVAI